MMACHLNFLPLIRADYNILHSNVSNGNETSSITDGTIYFNIRKNNNNLAMTIKSTPFYQ